MGEFLDLKTQQDFWHLIDEYLTIQADIETISFRNSLHRITAQDIKSPVFLPPFSRSTVDGFAVRAADTAGASASLPAYLQVIGEVLMGKKPEYILGPGEAVKISTGGMIPEGADAALMVEYTDYLDAHTIETTKAVAVGENIVVKGEDIKRDNLLLKKGYRIRPQDLAAMAGTGIVEFEVFKRVRVAVISTGDEIIPPEKNPAPGEIRDINSYSIGAVVEEMGAELRFVGIVEDSFSSLEKAVRDNLDCDLILISGGSSVGVKDITVDLLDSLGEPGVLLHGISIKPGKPTILAVIDGKPVLGLPGHPASSWTITQVLVKPLLQKLSGQVSGTRVNKVVAQISRNIVSDKGREEYIPVRINPVEQGKNYYLAEPITGKSSLITTLVEADGYIRIDTFKEGLNQGEEVEVITF